MQPTKLFSPRNFGKALAALGVGGLSVANSPTLSNNVEADNVHATLRVVVRGEGYAAQRDKILQEKNGDEAKIIAMSYASGLELVLVSDQPTTSKVLDTNHVAAMGLEPDQAMAVGRKQVLAALPPLPSPVDIGNSVLKSPNIDYIASLMLADGWDEMDKAFGGNLVVGVPSDDVILIANFPSEQARADFRAYVKQEYENANRSVSELVYVRRNGGWVVMPQ